MDTSTSSGLMEEYELMKQQKYRVYMTNIDKALKNFEYSSEWADLISALGKLNKVISSYSQYQIIPRRIKISKRLAQCMHPALPSGVHLKALETYDVIFSNTGVERLASELFIYSAGLFPLLGYAAMNVRPTLLGIYEKYFVPLGERLRPALSGFLSGVLPGLEAGLDHFERTNLLLGQVCTAVSPICFYTCLWECVATNASIRLPAISYVLDHFNKRLGMTEQTYLMGKNTELMMSGLCACLNDAVILVQRNTLEFLLLGFPMHTEIIRNSDLIKLVTNALNTILRRDMSLNRRLYSWLLGSDVISSNRKQKIESTSFGSINTPAAYFENYSKIILIKALRCTLKYSLQSNPVDLRPYKILISLLDKSEIGLAVLDDILCDVVRTMALSNSNIDVTKSANLLFATFDPAYIWDFMTQLYERGCITAKSCYNKMDEAQHYQLYKNDVTLSRFTPEVDSGQASLIEVCYLTEFLLETISLEMYNETTRVYLPRVFLAITQMLTIYSEYLTDYDITAALKLCTKIVSRVQPMITSPAKVADPPITVTKSTPISSSPHDITSNGLEKSKSDSKINQTLLDDEPIKRSNSNHSMGKKSPKKTKKSKSTSKLDVVDKDVCSDTGQLIISSTAVSTPNLDIDNTDNNKTKSSKSTPKKSPSPSRSAIISKSKSKGKPEETVTLAAAVTTTIGATQSQPLASSPASAQETTMQEYSILEKCIKQYEIFYQIYVARKVLQIDDTDPTTTATSEKRKSAVSFAEQEQQSNIPISPFYKEFVIEDTNGERLLELNKMFDTLLIDVSCRMKKLESLLHRSITVQSSSLNDLREVNGANERAGAGGAGVLPNSSSLEFQSHSKNSNQYGCDNSYLSLNINYEEDKGQALGKLQTKGDNERMEKLVERLMGRQLGESLRHSIKLASNILVELSTFPNYNQTLVVDHTDSDIPPWLKVLTLVACYTTSDKETQVAVVLTLFELISLLKSQVEHASNPGVTQAVMLPLLKFEHVNFIEQRTRIFQVLTSTLWEYLDSKTLDLTQIAALLYQLHNCLDSGVVESVIGNRITNAHLIWSNQTTDDHQKIDYHPSKMNFQSLDSGIYSDSRLLDYQMERLGNIKVMCTPPRQSMQDCNDTLSESEWNGFKKFELLWHLGRDNIQSQQRGFDKTLFKMFDVLELPHYISLRTFAIKWLKESLIRGDLGRLIKPLLNIILLGNTKRLSVVHVHMLKKDKEDNMSLFEAEKLEDEQKIVIEKDIYAVSSEDGTIRYHRDVSAKQKRSPNRPLRIFGVTIGPKNSSSKTLNYITDKTMPPPSSSPTTASLASTTTTAEANFSLIVNPMDNNYDTELTHDHDEYASLSSSAPSQMLTDFNNSPLLDTKNISCSYYTSSDEESAGCDSTGDSDDDELNERNGSEKENSNPTTAGVKRAPSISTVKKFAGDCEHVSEKLTQHDRTRNRKTYHLQKNVTNTNEKQFDSMLNEIHEGIIEDNSHDLDESTTTAEEFFDSTQQDDDQIVESVLHDLMEQAADSVATADDNKTAETNDLDTTSRNTEQSNLELDSCNFKPSDIHKRLSNTSKTSSESNCSESRIRNSSSVEPPSDSFSESEHSEKVRNTQDRSNVTRMKHKLSSVKKSEKRSKELKKKKAHLKPLTIETKLGYAQMTEKFEQSKINSEILRQNEQDKFTSRLAAAGDKNHPSHSHMLLYFGCYDTKQVLYAFQTLRNIISTDCRMFLCLSITTGVPNGQIKQLLVRHRKSIFGKGFDGSISNTEFYNVYRGCMYLEVLVTICLYYARSYFQAEEVESNQLPNADDIYGNCKIQSSSIELLTLIFNELISIVREMGRGLANYIADLLAKCKVQKIILHCVMTSVHSFTARNGTTFTEKLLQFNDPGDGKLHAETIQLQLLRLLFACVKLEYEVLAQKSDEAAPPSKDGGVAGVSQSPTRVVPATSVRYLPNSAISQQPLFLNAILSALQAENLRHLHRNWTDLVTSCLNCYTFGSLTNIVISVVHQICTNIDKIVKLKHLQKSYQTPPDYLVSQLEALTVLCHYCLLDNSQQLSLAHIFNPNNSYGSGATSSTTTNSAQLLNNLVHVFLSSNNSGGNSSDSSTATLKAAPPHISAARNAVLSHLPRIVASVAALWQTEMGQVRLVKQQLMELLSPVSLHHGVNFLTAIAVAWQERGDTNRKMQDASIDKTATTIFCSALLTGVRKDSGPPSTPSATTNKSSSALPQACVEQMLLVKLVSAIRVMPMDSFIQTLHQVVKTPPPIHHSPASSLDVSALELFYFYMKQAPATQLTEPWQSLLSLLRDGLTLSPPAQFVMLAILNEFVQRCPNMPFQDKKDLRDLHDITSKLVDSLSIIAGACLEQTTWLRRNLAVKEDTHITTTSSDGRSIRETMPLSGNQQYCVQAQSVLAAVLANLLDIAYGSQEKDKVVTIVTTLMYNIVPYLKNHTTRNIPSFYACSSLLASLSTYQYTRKAWRKDVFDLLLDTTFLHMDASCLPFWKSILDSLMTYDQTTFRDLMNRVSLTQTGSLNIFTSKEQEYEQRALLLKRLAFVIFCSELDQYHKYMPEIQEQLANSLRLPQVVPSIQAAVFLCFRVLLLRMSPDHVTSLWPTIIAEMVQVFLAIEQELITDTDEFSQHIRMLAGLDHSWVTNTNNGLQSHGHPHWRMVQLETAKLLELGCVLPATNLPHFQMYRWAFVGSQHDYGSADYINGDCQLGAHDPNHAFIPHVTRIARLMDLRYTTHSPSSQSQRGQHLVLTCQNIANLQDLYGFFSTLFVRWPTQHFAGDADKEIKNCLAEVEQVLAADFLEFPVQALVR